MFMMALVTPLGGTVELHRRLDLDFRLLLRFMFLTQLYGTRWVCEMEPVYIRQKSWPNDLHNVSLIPMTPQC